MRICQSCGRENPDDRDFCECGEYLRWDPTGFMEAVMPEAAAQPPAPQPKPAPQPAAPEPTPATPASQPAASAPPPGAAPEPPPPASAAPVPPAPAAAPEPPRAAAPPATTGFETYAAPPAPQPPVDEPPSEVQPAAPAPPVPPQPAAPAPVTPHQPAPPPPEAGNGHAAAPGGTMIQGAVPTPPAPPAPVEPDKPAMATITLKLPDGDPVKQEVLTLGVDPGGRERVQALVRNQSGIVDNYELSVRGLPDSWWTIYPNTLYLVPFGTGGTYEQQVEIHLHPPRSPETEARLWDLELVAYSKAHQTDGATAPFVLGIQPFEQYDTTVRPERASGRRKVRYRVAVDNRANAPLRVGFEGTEPDGECRFDFAPGQVEVHPGQTTQTTMTVRPPKQIWVGRPQERRLEVKTLTGEQLEGQEAEAPEGGTLDELGGGAKDALGKHVRGPKLAKPKLNAGGVGVGPSGVNVRAPQVRAPKLTGPQLKQHNLRLDQLKMPSRGQAPPPATGPLRPTQAVFRQKSWLPWWVAVVIPLLALLGLLLFLFLPKNVTVPDVVGSESAFAAEKTVTEAGLLLNPAQKQQPVSDPKQVGVVLDQTPTAGEKAEKGTTQVSIVVGVGDGKIEVPKVVGLDLAGAEKALREANLTLGKSSIQPPDPKAKIASQIPAEREVVKQGTPVDIFYPDPEAVAAAKAKAKAKDTDKAGGAAAAAGGGGGAGAADILVPAIADQKLDAYANQIGKEKLVPQLVKQFDDTPKGTLFATDPPGGTKVKSGSTVKLLVSAGFPQVAYDTNKDVLLVDPATDKKLDPIAEGSAREKDPTWSFDGTQVAFQSDGQVFLKDMTKPEDTAIALTDPGDFLRDLAWAPTGNANVIAMIRVPSADNALNELCFGQVSGKGLTPRCLAGPKDVEMERSVNWAPDGKSVLVFGTKVDASLNPTGTIGMLRFKTKKPFSADPDDWTAPKRFLTDVSQDNKGVLDAAISPDGKQMAVVSNFNPQGQFRLSLAKRNDFLLQNDKKLSVTACKAIWSPDSKELLVVQSDFCDQAETGDLVRVPLENPRDQHQLGLNGDNPSYQPLTIQ